MARAMGHGDLAHHADRRGLRRTRRDQHGSGRAADVPHGPKRRRLVCGVLGVRPLEPGRWHPEGQAGAREPVWLQAGDGRHLSVVLPDGFSVRFEPDNALYTEKGKLVGRAGDRIVLGQTRPSDAAGTFDDPYFASGLIFGDCYPVLKS